MQENPGVAVRLLNAFAEAYEFYRENPAQANAWFREASGLANVSDEALNLSASLEPNLVVSGTSRFYFTEEDFLIMQRGADFVARKTGAPAVSMRNFVTNIYSKK